MSGPFAEGGAGPSGSPLTTPPPGPPVLESLERVVLRQLKLGLQQYVGGHVLNSLRVGIHQAPIDFMTDSFVARITATVLSDELPPSFPSKVVDVEWSWPATWWQHWKDQHRDTWRWPAWAARRWPTRYETYHRSLTVTMDLRRYQTYPSARNFGLGSRDLRLTVAKHQAVWLDPAVSPMPKVKGARREPSRAGSLLDRPEPVARDE